MKLEDISKKIKCNYCGINKECEFRYIYNKHIRPEFPDVHAVSAFCAKYSIGYFVEEEGDENDKKAKNRAFQKIIKEWNEILAEDIQKIHNDLLDKKKKKK